jgi:uncharacterized SAM-binding protein YcdF (DUF218 family)
VVSLNAGEALIQPIGMIWIGLWLVMLQALRKKAWLAAGFAAVFGFLVWVLGATPVPSLLLARLERPYQHVRGAPLPAGDAVVMLGGAHAYSHRELLNFGTGEATDRILTAVELIRLRRARVLVLGGAKYRWRGQVRPDSELIAGWMRAWKMPVGEIELLGASRDTREEAERAVALARQRGWRRVLLVSSAYHLDRATATFRKLGLEVTPVGCDFLGLSASDGEEQWYVVPRWLGFQLAQYWVHEKAGQMWYWWKGWI